MLTYPMDERGSDTLYDYLYKCIKEDILSGRLESGSRLPSKRSFARNLGVSVITVETAYAQLAAEGFICSVEKKGYYVEELGLIRESGYEKHYDSDINNGGNVQNTKLKSRMTNADINFETYSRGNSINGINTVTVNNNSDKNVIPVRIDFVSNNVNYARFPFGTWSRLTRQVLSEQDEGLLRVAPVKGIRILREAIAEHLYNYRGLSVDPERIVIGSGTEHLYGILVKLLGRNKTYAVEDPGYNKVSYVLGADGVRCVHIPTDSSGMRMEELNNSAADIVHLTPSHHFPTGIVMPIQRRLEMLDWADRSGDRYIIEDEYDCEFRHQGKPIQTLSGIDRKGRVIYINTFSKTLAPSFRISYMVLPWELADRFDKNMGYMSCTVPNLDQYVLARFIKEGCYDRHINRMRVIYRGIRDKLLAAIWECSAADPDRSNINIMEENAGLHFLVKADTDMTDEALVDNAAAMGLNIRCLSDYAYDKENAEKHILIVNYSGIREDDIEEAAGLLGRLLKKTKLDGKIK